MPGGVPQCRASIDAACPAECTVVALAAPYAPWCGTAALLDSQDTHKPGHINIYLHTYPPQPTNVLAITMAEPHDFTFADIRPRSELAGLVSKPGTTPHHLTHPSSRTHNFKLNSDNVW